MQPEPEKLLTKKEAADLCRREVRTIERWVASRKLRFFRTPAGRILFKKNDVLRANEADRYPPNKPDAAMG